MLKTFHIVFVLNFGLLLTIMLSCSGEKKEEVLNMKDIAPQAKRSYDSDTITEKRKEDYAINEQLIDSLFGRFSFAVIQDKKMFPDRFSPKWMNKLALVNEVDSIFLYQWSFKDSTLTKNAFYNWIDCYGDRCKSIRLGEAAKFQRDNFVMLINDTSINYISSPLKVSEKNWIKYFEKEKGIENWKYIIYQRTGGKATWFEMTENKLIEQKPKL